MSKNKQDVVLFPKPDALYFAFYRGKDIVGRIIEIWTGGPFSHVELRFPDGMCYSSSGWDGGTRKKRIGFSSPWLWTCVEIPNVNIAAIRARAEDLLGKKYDYKGIWFWFVTKRKKQDDNRWWCSEYCAYVIPWKPFRLCPNALYRKAMRYLRDIAVGA